MRLSKGKKAGIVIALTVVLLVVDQVTKILVKTNMHLGESISVFGDWFQILFIENEGMAFGMSFGGDIGKYILTSFRLILSVLLLVYIRHLLRKKDAPLGVLLGFRCGRAGPVRGRLRAFRLGEGGGYAVFPDNQYHMAGLGSGQGRGFADIFPSHLQHC